MTAGWLNFFVSDIRWLISSHYQKTQMSSSEYLSKLTTLLKSVRLRKGMGFVLLKSETVRFT